MQPYVQEVGLPPGRNTRLSLGCLLFQACICSESTRDMCRGQVGVSTFKPSKEAGDVYRPKGSKIGLQALASVTFPRLNPSTETSCGGDHLFASFTWVNFSMLIAAQSLILKYPHLSLVTAITCEVLDLWNQIQVSFHWLFSKIDLFGHRTLRCLHTYHSRRSGAVLHARKSVYANVCSLQFNPVYVLLVE